MMQAARIWSSCRCAFPQYRRAASSTGLTPPVALELVAQAVLSAGGRSRSRGGAAQQRGASGAGRADSGSPCPVPPCARHRAIRPRAPPHTLLARACARLRGPSPRVFPPLSHRHRHHAHHPPDTPCPPAVPPSGRAACPGRNPRPPPSSRLLLPTPRPVSRPASAAAAAAGQRSSGGRAGASGQRLPVPGSPVHAKSPPAPAPPSRQLRSCHVCFFLFSTAVKNGPTRAYR